MKKYQKNKGVSALLFILAFCFIALLALAGMQSRLLLSIRRSVATYDQIVSIYTAESHLTDIVTRLAEGYDIEAPDSEGVYYEEELADGTKLLLEYKRDIDGQGYFDIIATRNLASRRIGAGFLDTVTSGEAGEAHVTIAMDCTGSMNSDACAPGTCPFNDRIDALEQAMKDFVTAVRDSGLPIKLGVAAFGGRTNWIHTDPVNQTGTLIIPSNNVPYDDILRAIDEGFVDIDSNSQNTSSICQNYSDRGGTNLGNPLGIFHDYYKTVGENVKKIEIIITDGVSTSRTPYAGCPPLKVGNDTCLNAQDNPALNECVYEGVNFLQCTISEADKGGVRPADIDVYSLSIGMDGTQVVRDVKAIFEEHSTKYYDMKTASELPEIIIFVQKEVEQSVTRTIKLFK